MTAFISARGLIKRFRKGDNDIIPLSNLDLDVERGSFIALMGPSGSGKTTLLNLLAGIDRPTAGELLIDGRPIHAMNRRTLTAWRAQSVGYIFQLYHLIPVLTAFENIELPLLLKSLSRAERQQRVHVALDLVGLRDRAEHFPNQLSGGQEQRVAIARAIIADPALLVADEPTGDLDSESAAAILSLLQRLSREHGKTIVMVTHDPRAAKVADRCLHLEKGRLINETSAAL